MNYYFVIEMQKDGTSLTTHTYGFETLTEADSKYYDVLSKAAASTIERYSASLLDIDGKCIRNGSYSNGQESEEEVTPIAYENAIDGTLTFEEIEGVRSCTLSSVSTPINKSYIVPTINGVTYIATELNSDSTTETGYIYGTFEDDGSAVDPSPNGAPIAVVYEPDGGSATITLASSMLEETYSIKIDVPQNESEQQLPEPEQESTPESESEPESTHNDFVTLATIENVTFTEDIDNGYYYSDELLSPLNGSTIRVTLNDTPYELPLVENSTYYYGEIVEEQRIFTTYPVFVEYSDVNNSLIIYTDAAHALNGETPIEYTITLENFQESEVNS